MAAVERNIERNDRIRETAKRNPSWSMVQVAQNLGLTRGVVVGVLDRDRGTVATERRPGWEARTAAPKAPPATPRPPAAVSAKEPVPETRHPDGMLRVNLVSLRSHHCRAPLDARGSNGLETFCGLEKVPMSSYCRHHRLRYGGGSLAG